MVNWVQQRRTQLLNFRNRINFISTFSKIIEYETFEGDIFGDIGVTALSKMKVSSVRYRTDQQIIARSIGYIYIFKYYNYIYICYGHDGINLPCYIQLPCYVQLGLCSAVLRVTRVKYLVQTSFKASCQFK